MKIRDTGITTDNLRKDPDCIAIGSQFAIRIKPRGKCDPHVIFEVYSEDDEYWSFSLDASSFWIPDMISVLQKAKKVLETHARFTPDGKFGIKFND